MQNNQSNIKVRRASVDSVELYEVKEHELMHLERGSDADLYFNFSIFLFSTAFACNLTFVSATFNKPIYETFAVVVTVVGYFGALLLFILWIRNRKNVKDIIKQIRKRLPAEAVTSTDPDSIQIAPLVQPTPMNDTTMPEG